MSSKRRRTPRVPSKKRDPEGRSPKERSPEGRPGPRPALIRPGTRVLHVDQELVAVEKAAGQLSHPHRPGNEAPCPFLGSYDPDRRCFRDGGERLWLLHRLDQETSGVLLAARSHEAYRRLREAFEEGRVEKRYRTLLLRAPKPARGRWEDRLVKERGTGRVRSRILAQGAPDARLAYRVLEFLPGRPGPAYVEVLLETGRTHQIRVQAAHRRLAVAGDGVYGDFRRNRELRRELGLRRIFLHAARLVVPAPDGRPVTISCPLAPDLEEVLTRARAARQG